MSIAVMLSVQPTWCVKIANREKPLEIRKTRPKIDTPFKCYIYCTKGGEAVWSKHYERDGYLNGKVIGEFVCDWIQPFGFSPFSHGVYIGIENIHELSCVGFEEMWDYIGDRYGYGWHISDLAIYDKPRDLAGFRKPDGAADPFFKRPPQSWCYVEVDS